MVYSKIENYALKIVQPIAKSEGYDIYDVEYIKEGPHWFLRIYIESENGVILDDCETISRTLSSRLDEDDMIKENYFLEVSSPGLERVLRQSSHFDRAVGEKISVKQKNGKTQEGILAGHTGESITLDANIIIQKQDIQKANVVYDFTV